MPKAFWKNRLIAESDTFETVENNVYFPPDSVNSEFLEPSDHHTTCGWKGEASYYHVLVDGVRNENAAWYYPDPKPAAQNIEGFIAFWKGVEVEP